MAPQVLVQNPESALKACPQGLTVTTWDPETFWIEKNFSFSGVFLSGTGQDFSPYLLMEARSAFIISLLDLGTDTYLAGMSELSSLLLFLRSKALVFSTNPFTQHLAEYSLRHTSSTKVEGGYAQMVIWNEDPEKHLKFFAQHGRIFLASSIEYPQIPEGFFLEYQWQYSDQSEIGELYLYQLAR